MVDNRGAALHKAAMACFRGCGRLAFILAFAFLVACGDDDGGSAEAPQSAVLVVAAAEPDALRERLLASLGGYLERLTGETPAVVREGDATSLARIARRAQASRAGLVFVLDAEVLLPDEVSAAQSAALPAGGYRIATKEVGDFANRLADGDRGATVLLLAGADRLARQYAVYEALRRLGVRYYHPEEEYVPRLPLAQLRARAATPTIVARRSAGVVSDDYVPDFAYRGYTFHGAHPLEQLEAFSDGDFPIDEAVNVIDWMVKNRGETFRGAGRGVAAGEARARRVAELEDLRVLLGMSRGTGITLHNVQQGGRPEIDPMSDVPVQEQIETLVTQRLAATPDATQFGIHFGPTEVSTTPDLETVQWINWAGAKSLELRPDIPVIINDHTSGFQPVQHFDDLGCPPGTNDRGVADYYDLAFHTDPRIGVSVHTVMFYPLEGPAPVYNQKTFAHKLCLMERGSADGRPLEWFPESSWWLTFDNPVPVYLPLHLYTRQRDVELVAPLLEKNGGTLRRHKEFNSGHEWGYWQQDYAVGLWHWNVDVPFDAVLGELFDPLCDPAVWPASCAARDEAVAALAEVIEQQRELFLERTDYKGQAGGLYVYFSGEDQATELAARAGFVFHPVRVGFATVAAWDDDAAAHFRATDLAALREAGEDYAGWVERLHAVAGQVPAEGAPWLAELLDGVEIDGLRARHAAALYEAVLAFRDAAAAGAADPAAAAQEWLDRASLLLGDAEAVIRRREAAYRYPAAQEYGGGVTPETAVANGTTYGYRVHTKTHLLTFWHNRREAAVAAIAGAGQDEDRVSLTPVFAAPGRGAAHRVAGGSHRHARPRRRHVGRRVGRRARVRECGCLPDLRHRRARGDSDRGCRCRDAQRTARGDEPRCAGAQRSRRHGRGGVHPRHQPGLLLRRRRRHPGVCQRRLGRRALSFLASRDGAIERRGRRRLRQLARRFRHRARRLERRRGAAAPHRTHRRFLRRNTGCQRLRRFDRRRRQDRRRRHRATAHRAHRLRRARRARLPRRCLRRAGGGATGRGAVPRRAAAGNSPGLRKRGRRRTVPRHSVRSPAETPSRISSTAKTSTIR